LRQAQSPATRRDDPLADADALVGILRDRRLERRIHGEVSDAAEHSTGFSPPSNTSTL
jgi:hypothetical protein